jgi:hypothetical protein
MKKTTIFQFAICAMLPFSVVAQTSTAWRAKVDPVVLKKAALLTHSHATFRSFWVTNCVLITADVATLQAVAELASVEEIMVKMEF